MRVLQNLVSHRDTVGLAVAGVPYRHGVGDDVTRNCICRAGLINFKFWFAQNQGLGRGFIVGKIQFASGRCDCCLIHDLATRAILLRFKHYGEGTALIRLECASVTRDRVAVELAARARNEDETSWNQISHGDVFRCVRAEVFNLHLETDVLTALHGSRSGLFNRHIH